MIKKTCYKWWEKDYGRITRRDPGLVVKLVVKDFYFGGKYQNTQFLNHKLFHETIKPSH